MSRLFPPPLAGKLSCIVQLGEVLLALFPSNKEASALAIFFLFENALHCFLPRGNLAVLLFFHKEKVLMLFFPSQKELFSGSVALLLYFTGHQLPDFLTEFEIQ